MKRCVWNLLVIVLGVSGPAAAQQRAPDAVAVDPVVHNVLLENEHVRVFDARAAHGATTPMHSHPPFVFVGLDFARVRLTTPDGKSAILDIYPGQVMWLENAQHSWELLSGGLHVIGVEIKAAQAGAPPPAVPRRANDSVAVDPAVHHVVLENDYVRVFDGRASAGARSPMHSHPASLLVMIGRARGELTLPDGKTAIVNYDPGRVMWAEDGMEHAWKMLSGHAHVVVIEPKSAARAPKSDE